MPYSSVAEYQEKRSAFIDEDRALRRDRESAKRSLAEVAADQFVREIRAAEEASIWRQGHDNITHPFPGMEFLTGTSYPKHLCDP